MCAKQTGFNHARNASFSCVCAPDFVESARVSVWLIIKTKRILRALCVHAVGLVQIVMQALIVFRILQQMRFTVDKVVAIHEDVHIVSIVCA